MTGRKHQYFGMMYALSIAILFEFPFLYAAQPDHYGLYWFITGILFGSVLPDIDHPKSTLGRLFRPITLVLDWLFRPITRLMRAEALFTHRGFTHSLLALGLFAAVSYYLLSGFQPLWIGLTLGYISHLIGDMFTVRGCQIFWPYRRHFRLPVTVRTGSFAETMLLAAVFVGFACLLWWKI